MRKKPEMLSNLPINDEQTTSPQKACPYSTEREIIHLWKQLPNSRPFQITTVEEEPNGKHQNVIWAIRHPANNGDMFTIYTLSLVLGQPLQSKSLSPSSARIRQKNKTTDCTSTSKISQHQKRATFSTATLSQARWILPNWSQRSKPSYRFERWPLILFQYSRLLAPSSTTYQISKTDTRVKKGFFDVAFSQYLSDNGIYLTDDWDPAAAPSNHAEIKNRLAQRRRSLSPSALTNTDYVKFQKQNHWAQNAQSVMQDVLPVITGHSDIPHSGGFFFKNLKPLTDKSLNLQPAFPDSYDGCHPEELDRSIREQLGEYIIPLSERNVPCLPTYFTVLMGPDDTMPVGYRQILYEGSLGARAVHQLRCFISNAATALDNNAYVLAALYNSSFGSLWIYAIRPVAASQNSDAEFPIEYRITLIDSFHLTKSPDDLRDGISAWRNAREWAKEKRDELVKAANMKAASFRSSSTGAGVGSSADRDGSEWGWEKRNGGFFSNASWRANSRASSRAG